MKVYCPNCNKAILLKDEIFEKKERIKGRCPHCKKEIVLTRPEKLQEDEIQSTKFSIKDEVTKEEYEYEEYEEEENDIEEGFEREKALIAIEDKSIRKLLCSIFEKMQILPVVATHKRNIREDIYYNMFSIIITTETYPLEQETLLKFISSLKMNVRRELFVILVGDDLKTGDEIGAFAKSVNMLLNTHDVPELPSLLPKELRIFSNYYKAFFKVQGDLGYDLFGF